MRNSQTPRTKLERSTKHQASKNGSVGVAPKIGRSTYPTSKSEAWVLKDEHSDDGTNLHGFDLVERTALFGEAIIRFCKRVPRGPVTDRLISQLIGASTSVGANYCEASESQSKKDFKCSISRCVKEAKETKHFLRMIAAAEPELLVDARQLYREANELHLIFASIYRK